MKGEEFAARWDEKSFNSTGNAFVVLLWAIGLAWEGPIAIAAQPADRFFYAALPRLAVTRQRSAASKPSRSPRPLRSMNYVCIATCIRSRAPDSSSMFRKLFVRLLLSAVALLGIIVLAVGIAGYLALQRPAFYTDLLAQQFSSSDQLAANASIQLIGEDLRRWTDRSLALQRVQLLPDSAKHANASLEALALKSPPGDYDPTQDTHSISVSAQQINAQFASQKVSTTSQWQNPRIRIGQDRIDLGFEFVTSTASCVLSAELKPTLASDGQLRLDLLSTRIGRLPIPLGTILRLLPREAFRLGSDLQFNATAPTPYLCLNLPNQSGKSPAVKSIKCTDGEITIELSAPVLNGRQTERRTTPLAISR
jgi:hypothetical protein